MKAKVKVAQSCPTLCAPTDSTVHGILQARILEWVAVPFSEYKHRGSIFSVSNFIQYECSEENHCLNQITHVRGPAHSRQLMEARLLPMT